MNLKEYSNGIKQIIRGNAGEEAFKIVKDLPKGETKKLFGFAKGDKTLRIISPIKDLQTIFDMITRFTPQKDYTMTLRVSKNNKAATVSRSAEAETPLDYIRKGLYSGAERIFYEIITTDDFEITSSEFEGLIIKCGDPSLLNMFFQALVGLFPFVEVNKENSKMGVECLFDVTERVYTTTEQKMKGTLKCVITLDGQQVGLKSNTFVF